MPRGETPATESFDEQLSKLRMRIDLLPPDQRSHLYALADTIARQHQRLVASAGPTRTDSGSRSDATMAESASGLAFS